MEKIEGIGGESSSLLQRTAICKAKLVRPFYVLGKSRM
jgi:hypothetical protein